MRKFENLFPRWIGAGTVLMCPFSPTVAVVEGATLPAGQGFFKRDAYDIVKRSSEPRLGLGQDDLMETMIRHLV